MRVNYTDNATSTYPPEVFDSKNADKHNHHQQQHQGSNQYDYEGKYNHTKMTVPEDYWKLTTTPYFGHQCVYTDAEHPRHSFDIPS
jgi:hypothetical protein